jgi:hypothetical protein
VNNSGFATNFKIGLKEDKTNKVTSISSGSTDVQYPSAKLTYDQLALKAPISVYPATGLTTGYLPYKSSTVLVNSPVFTNGTNIGIGTTSPNSKLEVYSSTGSTRLKLSNSTSGSSATTGLDFQKDGLDAYIWNYDNGTLYFATNNSVKLSIGSTGNFNFNTGQVYILGSRGNVGIGYSSGTEIFNNKLAVNGTGYFSSTVEATGYKLSGISTFLNPFRTGYSGTANQLLVSTGPNTTFAWTTGTPAMVGLSEVTNNAQWHSGNHPTTISGYGITDAMTKEAADEFTATASQTIFTLTQIPKVSSKVKAYINGIRISNSAYSIIGNSVTYFPSNNGSYSLKEGDRIQFDYIY